MTVYFLNTLADYEEDIQTKRLSIIGAISRSTYQKLFVLFLCLFTSLGIAINTTVFTLSLIALLLWIMYYLPPFRLKSTFLLGTVIHLFAGILHFHTGYCSLYAFSERSVAISIFFALLLCVGHFHHETIDYEADKVSGNRTTAVRIGISNVFRLRSILIGVTLVYYSIIYWKNYVGNDEYALFVIPTVILFILSIILKENSVLSFQTISRSLYLLAGIMLFFLKLTALKNHSY
jgi:4-hydroxybenzoate polyprenyltransferase